MFLAWIFNKGLTSISTQSVTYTAGLFLAGQLLDKWAPGGVPKLEPGFFLPPRDYVEPYRRDEPLLSLKVL